MGTFTEKEAWVLNKIYNTIRHGKLILKDNRPFILIKNEEDCPIHKNHSVYYSLNEALEAQKEYKAQIKDLCEETRKNIEKLDSVSNDLASREEYIPEDILNTGKNYERYRDISELLTTYIQSGVLNVNVVSFTKESVSHVNWGETAAEIVLKSGQKITTYNLVELELVTRVFGGNNSERYFTKIKPGKEEDDD